MSMTVEAPPELNWRDRAITLTRWRNLVTPEGGEQVTITFGTFIQWIRAPITIDRVEGLETILSGFSIALFANNYRRAENCTALDALVLDYDKNVLLTNVQALWQGYAGALHTTKKHLTPGYGARCRVILPYTRPVTPAEHVRLWGWADNLSRVAQLEVDSSTRDVSRFWFVPSRLATAPYEVVELDGALLDPDVVLASPPANVLDFVLRNVSANDPLRVTSEALPGQRTGPPIADPSIDQLFEEIANAPKGGRNMILSRNAFWVFQRVDQGTIAEEEALRRLIEAAEACAARTNDGQGDLLEFEIRSTIRRAREDAAASPRPRPLSALRAVENPVERVFQGFTDLDYAEGFVMAYGQDVRITYAEKWAVWDGKRWGRAGQTTARSLLQDFVREVTTETRQIPEEKVAKAYYGKAKAGEGSRRIDGALKSVAHDARIRVDPAVFESSPMKLTCQNGTVDLRTGMLLPFDRADLISHLVPTNYDPGAQAPRWRQFIEEVTLGRPGLVDFLHKWVGYCLTGEVSEQCFVLATGTGANGKGTLAETLMEVIGRDLTAPQAPKFLLETRNDRHPVELKDIEGSRIVFVSEVPVGARFDEERVKLLAGGDRFKARGMREDFTTIRPTAKLFIYVNDRPSVRDHSDAFWRRVRTVPFDASFKDNGDKDLKPKLLAEAEGILAWAVEGCLAWLREGLPKPPEVIAATESYQKEQDVYRRFVEDYQLAGRKIEGRSTNELFQGFVIWAERERCPVVSQTAFTLQIKRLGYFTYKKAGDRFWTTDPALGKAENQPEGPSDVSTASLGDAPAPTA